tara:strand:+ start:49 stop:1785 length:1737 start_codon:yes stop_codon:yes gene_type:complete
VIGAEYIAAFLEKQNCNNIFLVTGGACAFIVDAISRNPSLRYIPMHHEQSAAMAADVAWKVKRKVGVTLATSGPGATNLITGIACSYFDSIPSIHITGQVNKKEKIPFQNANVRQAGFQETKIVEMVKPITKYAVKVNTTEELRKELAKAYAIALQDRKGPVLIDVPMDVQQAEVKEEILLPKISTENLDIELCKEKINNFFRDSTQPLVLLGAGPGLSDKSEEVLKWLNLNSIPFVSSWNGMCFVKNNNKNYYGNIGVYGNRGANFILQSCDRLLVLGSRLDNRQRGSNVDNFAPLADVLVLDVDEEELKKHSNESRYSVQKFNFSSSQELFRDFNVKFSGKYNEWESFCNEIKSKYFGKYPSTSSQNYKSTNPCEIVERVNTLIKPDSIVTVDTGANLCWVFQAFKRSEQIIFTAGGNSPMGYSLPAAIASAIECPDKQVISFIGDGSFQINIQELQTMSYHKLPLKLFIMNNFGYGIIKQFQDTWLEARHEASGRVYSQPDFKKIAHAYNVSYRKISSPRDIVKEDLNSKEAVIFDVFLHPDTLIEPKKVTGNPLHNMFPYLDLSSDSLEKKYIK